MRSHLLNTSENIISLLNVFLFFFYFMLHISFLVYYIFQSSVHILKVIILKSFGSNDRDLRSNFTQISIFNFISRCFYISHQLIYHTHSITLLVLNYISFIKYTVLVSVGFSLIKFLTSQNRQKILFSMKFRTFVSHQKP